MSFSVDTDTLLTELEAVENIRLSQAQGYMQALRGTDVRGLTGMAGAISTSQRELAALAQAHADGTEPSVAQLQSQNMMADLGPARATGGGMTADLQAQRQQMDAASQIAGQGAMARVQEGAQFQQMGLDTLGVNRGVREARHRKQQELGLALAEMGLQSEARAAGRSASTAQTRMGIETEQYITDSRRRDTRQRQAIGGGLTLLGTALATQAGKKPGTAAVGEVTGSPGAQEVRL